MMSVSNNDILYKSTNPITFLGWLELQEKVSPDFNTNLKNYQLYIKSWSENKKNNKSLSKNFFTDLYVDLIKEITLNFVTEEEKRFIVNFDYTKEENLDIILPFFIEKIKNICLFYSNKREKLQRKLTILPYKGTDMSVKNIVKDIIIEGIESGSTLKIGEGKVSFPSLSAITKNLDVGVSELYDGEDYFNSSTSLKLLSGFGYVDIDSNLYLNFKESIIDAIKQYPLLIEGLISPFSINYTISGDELNLLKDRDFINYLKSTDSEDLKLSLKKKLAPKYLGSDFYFLSVGNTESNIASGLLFSTKPPSGSNVQNFLNAESVNIATVQSLENLYTAYEIGKFFIPSNTGILQYTTFQKQFYLNYKKLSPNSIYIFPDPSKIEPSQDNSPLVYKIDTSWNKFKLNDGFRFGDVISDGQFHRFYPYESLSQDVLTQPYGLSISKDNVDFWSGDKNSVWTEKNLWPGLEEIEKLPIQSRLQSLLFDKGELVDWFSDIYGNEFGLYKRKSQDKSIFNKNKIDIGDLYIKNTLTNLVSTGSHFLNRIYLKYPEKISKELLSNHIISLYVIKNVFIIETKNYVVIDSYDFELNTGKFLNTLIPGIYIPKHTINENLEKYINSFYVEGTNKVYLCFLKLLPSLSASNYKNLYPTIYEMDVDSLEFKQKYPGLSFDVSYNTLSSNKYDNFSEIDLRYVEGGKFSYKEKFNIFNLTYYALNLNNIPFIVNEQFSLSDGSGDLVSYIPILNKPYFYTRDINFSNPTVDFNFRFTGNYSEPAGYKDLSNFNFDLIDTSYNNFYYSTKVNPVFLNTPGSHYVYFDFDQYIFGNLFVGCENVRVTRIENSNFIEFFTSTNTLTNIRIQSDDVWFKVRDYNFKNHTFTLSAYRPKNTNNNIILFNINTTLSGFSGVFCDNLFSVYRNVKVDKRGTGIGIVTSDPFCVDCGDLCEFLYPLYGTLVLVPSAGPGSVFSGWIGGNCTGLAGNCIVNITDTTTLTAVFNKIPEYTLNVNTNLSGTSIVTLDGKIVCGDSCTAIYRDGEVAVVSASQAPVGYFFSGFQGGPCGGNNPCNILMSQNYSITATYLSGNSNIFLYKNYNNNNTDTKIGPIVGNALEENFELITADNKILAYNEGNPNLGTMVCSLSPDQPIKGFANFVLPRNDFFSVTALSDNNVSFKNYDGNPCRFSRSVCSFFATENYSITGNFGSPLYTLNISNSGSGLFYVESDTGEINCGNRSLINFRDKCFATYLSGTIITLSAIAVGESRVIYISGSTFGATALDPSAGEATLATTFAITKNETVTAVSKLAAERTLTVIKSAFNNTSNSYLQSIIEIDEIGFSKKQISSGVERQTFVFDDSTQLVIYPTFVPASNLYLYTIGSSGLYYFYDVSPGLNIIDQNDPEQNPVLMFQSDQIISNSIAIQIIPNPGFAPVYSLPGSNLITINNDQNAYITLNQSSTAILVFTDQEFLAKQENILDPIYTQSSQLIYK